MSSRNQTIFALASAPGRAGVAVFRVSGPDAAQAITTLCAPPALPAPRAAAMRTLRDPQNRADIDKALVLYFQAPHSFTGEDVVEFQTHGGRAVIAAVTSALSQLPGFRLAEPGEFTRRAFENGKMDLTEAEAVADLVHADTEAQRKQALRQMDGALGRLYEDWRARLSRGLAYMEAAIDFADEELPDDLIDQQSADLRDLRAAIAAHLNDNRRGERLRDGFYIAILGAPNAGKSSLLNALAQRDAAIVSPVAGTTRDVIEVHLDIGDYPVTLADTAGLRDSADSIEAEGIRRSHARAVQADLKLLVLDAAAPGIDDTLRPLVDADTIVVANKIDIAPAHTEPAYAERVMAVSALTGAGIADLLDRLAREIDTRFHAADTPVLTRARHRAALEDCVASLDRALATAQPDLRAEDVRLAMRALGRITGRVDVEDLLDIIFRDFCIGK
ncbi:MAG: tRNA uridine-5-carboxymethylaminomethyl(34) synthesis GTPase MnmE [Alphaproteobacteria bacterium]|nr:tRNA uridine-5-carboxymethylaminomethyl(34) synthesis GTPase MnmE [Alphaproteobacteria bacterium]